MKYSLMLILLFFISCGHYKAINNRALASVASKSCSEMITPFLVNNGRQLQTEISLSKESEKLTKSQLRELYFAIETIDNNLIGLTETLVAPENTELIVHRGGEEAYFNSFGNVISTPYRFSQNAVSHYKTPWAKETVDPNLKRRIGPKGIVPEGKAQYGNRWITNAVREPHRGQLRTYNKHPKFTRAILVHEYGHSILNANMGAKNEAFSEFVELSALHLKADHNYKVELERYTKIQEQLLEQLKLENPDIVGIYKLSQFPIMKELKASWKPRLSELDKQSNELLQKVWNSPFSRYANNDFSRYNELFADVTSVIYAKGDPKALSDALGFAKTSQDLKKYGATSSVISSRDFSFIGNRIDRWIENKHSISVHNAMAPSRYYLYERFFKRPHYQSGVGAAKLYEKILDVISLEIDFRIANPKTKLSWTEWNQRFIDLLEEATTRWR